VIKPVPSTEAATAGGAAPAGAKARSRARVQLIAPDSILGNVLARPATTAAALLLAALVVLAVIVPLLSIKPNAIDLNSVDVAPTMKHLLGTDQLGRDILSRLIAATPVSLSAGTIAMLVAFGIGLPLAVISAYAGGIVDLVLARIVDGMLAVPPLLTSIVVVSALRPSLRSAMIAIGIIISPAVFRVVRSAVLTIRTETFIEAARVSGASHPRILLRHVLPNLVGILSVQVPIAMGQAIVVEAALSFIGLGVQPPQASWGSMLKQAASYMGAAPVTSLLAPSLTIIVVVFALNTLADGLRAAIAPLRR
jgi:peptide/nickel transport system permease protein